MRFSALAPAILIPLALTTGIASAEVAFVDLEALEQVYDVLGGTGWVNNQGWKMPGVDPCAFPNAWFGVRCNDDKTRVVAIRLLGNRLSGRVTDLTKFRNLTDLGQLELGNNLDIAVSRWNHLSGDLPAGFEALSNLFYLDMRFNEISGNLGVFTSLSQLQYLALEENQFSGSIPSEIGGLTSLTLLTLNGNQLTGEIPAELGQLTQLTTLWLYDNALEGSIPSELGALSQLTELRLGGNALRGSIPPSLGNLHLLRTLEIGLAFLEGALPPEFAQLNQLKILSLGTNRLTGDLGAVNWSLMTALEEVYLDTNLFSGSLPENLASLQNLRILRLRANALRGDVPASYIDLLSRASELDLRWNALDPSASATQALDLRSNGEFSATQTVAPRSITAVSRPPAGIFVSWTPIPFLAGDGGYRLDVFSNPDGSGTPIRQLVVAGKERSSALVGGVPTGSPLSIRITSFTASHPLNPGPVESAASSPVPVDAPRGGGMAMFERDRYVVKEGDVLSVNVFRLEGTSGSLEATVSARPGSATAGDYLPPRPPRLNWPAGDAAAKGVQLATVSDTRNEPTKTLDLTVSTGANTAIATIEIGDRVVAGTATDPVIATNSHGLSFAVWIRPQANGALRDLFGRFLDANGAAMGSVIEVAADQRLDEHDPAVVALADDTFVVAWIENRQDLSGQSTGLCRPTAGELRCTRRVQFSNGPDVNGLALTADGNSYWLGWTKRAGFFALPGSALEGTPSPPVLVASPPSNGTQVFVQPQIVRLRADRLVAVWNGVLPNAGAVELGGEIQAQAFSPAGTLVGDRRRFGGSDVTVQRRPKAVRVNDTGAFVTWEENGGVAAGGEPRVAWTQVPGEAVPNPVVARISAAGRAVASLSVLRGAAQCHVVWLSLTGSDPRFERRSVPNCSPTAAPQTKPGPIFDPAEGSPQSFAATLNARGLYFLEELAAARGIRWLKSARTAVP